LQDSDDMFVKDVMKKDIKTVTSETTVFDAAKRMAENNIGCLVVVDNALEGIVTERDILVKVVSKGKDPAQVLIREIMTRNVISISPDKVIEEASDLMSTNRIKRLPVVFGDEVVGILTSTDVVEVLSKLIKEIYSQQ
jgi:CBS domain-containing protein